MSEPSKTKKMRFFRSSYHTDTRYALLAYIILALPQLLFLFLYLIEQPIDGNLRFILPIVSVALLVLSLFTWAFNYFGILRPISDIIRNMEERHKIGSETDGKRKILDSLESLSEYMHKWEEQQNRLEILQKQANLYAYQSQINPHFLYNMLDTIRGQALEDGSVIASDMIEALSRMMRYAISNKDSMVTLGTEIKSIDNYIKIQQFRFGNRFQYMKHFDEIDNSLIEMKIPKMTLQPIVENAIFHGVESLIKDGVISMTAFNTQSRLIVQISDNGNGMDEEQLNDVRRRLLSSNIEPKNGDGNGTGIALSNVNARLKLAFGSQYGLSVFSTKNVGTMVEVTLPINIENR